MRAGILAAASVAFASTAGGAWAVTPLSGFLQAQTHAFANGGALSDTDAQADSWSGTPQDSSVFVRSEVDFDYQEFGLSIAAARALDRATWAADGASGSVELDWRWDFPTIGGTGALDTELRGADFNGLKTNWSYTFRADHDGLLVWEGQVRPSPEAPNNQTFGLSGWNLQLNGVTVIDLFDTSGAGPRLGDRDFALVAGETYTFSLVNNSNIAGYTFDRNYRGQMLGEFYWAILETPTAVPEPGVWTLLILGFGLVGASIRRRRPHACV